MMVAVAAVVVAVGTVTLRSGVAVGAASRAETARAGAAIAARADTVYAARAPAAARRCGRARRCGIGALAGQQAMGELLGRSKASVPK